MTRTVLIAGATGYAGRHLVAEYLAQGWTVRALVRDAARARSLGLGAADLIEAEATRPHSLLGVMGGVDLVISALGLTRQRDGLLPGDVDYQANVNLLNEALRAGVGRFAYIHVLNAHEMAHVPLVAAKMAFVRHLQASQMPSTVIAPTGYFSDMEDMLRMADMGRVWLFGDGCARLNPIHGADLARISSQAISVGRRWQDAGGPEVFSQNRLAQTAFAALRRPARVTHLPDVLRQLAQTLLPRLTPERLHGPILFFLEAMGHDMVGPRLGTHRLSDHFAALAAQPELIDAQI